AGVPLNITNKEIIIEDEGELRQDQYWFGSGVYTATPSSKLIVMPLGEYFMTVSSLDNTIKRTVGQESKKNDGNWHNWKWVQDGTKTIIIPSTGEFQAIADSGSQIEISYSTGDVVTPITIESGVAATIPTGLNINMRRSTFVNHGTVEIYGTLDTSVKDSYPGGMLENYGTIYINAGGKLNTSREGSLTNEGSIVNTGGTWTE
ncbi:MAG: hypothetical protein M0Q37_04555, partial [Sphaerochaeta sp.]|nr:hypothetical protein [Sphaerochaeta sp.]